mmetsp:Transcript_12902/g.20677  ORF Transcript_12902/g.20677 Transcript_12902/m.20677 type:complete len:666 (+) Transcript_12902:65-2062(+)
MPKKAKLKALLAQKAEEERLAREAEEKRLAEQRVKIKALKKEFAEVRRQDLMKETARLKEEFHEYRTEESTVHKKLREIDAEIRKRHDWQEFLSCSELPDPNDAPQLNSFITMQQEEIGKHSVDLVKVLQVCNKSSEMLRIIEDAMAEYIQEGDNGAGYERLQKSRDCLREKTLNFLDQVTLNLLRHGEQMVDKHGILLRGASNGGLNLGLWIRYPDESKQKNSDVADISWKDIGASLARLPMELRIVRTGVRFLQIDFDQVSTKAKKLQAYVSVGGLFKISRIDIPVEATRPRGWLRQDENDSTRDLSVLKYPKNGIDNGMLDIQVEVKIPESVFIPANALTTWRIGWWDAEKETWVFDGVREGFKIDEKTRSLSLKVWRMECFAILQPRSLDFPYIEWRLICNTEEKGPSVTLTLTGSRYEVKIKISADGARLVYPEIPSFSEKPMATGSLLFGLQRAGLNLIPTQEDAKFCCKTPKTQKLLEKANSCIASVAGVLDIMSSNYSCSQGPNAALIKIREKNYSPPPKKVVEEKQEEEESAPALSKEELKQLEIQREKAAERKELIAVMTKETAEDRKNKAISDDKDGWRTALALDTKWMLPKASRFHLRKNKYEVAEGMETHLTLKLCVSSVFPDAAKEFANANLLLQRNVRRVLNLVDVLTFH